MAVFIILFVAWVVLTVLGHASWVLVAAVLRAIFGSVDSDVRPGGPGSAKFVGPNVRSEGNSLGQFRGVIFGLIDAGQLTNEEGAALVQKASQTLGPTLGHSSRQPASSVAKLAPSPTKTPLDFTTPLPESSLENDPVLVAELVSDELETTSVAQAAVVDEVETAPPVSWRSVVGSFLEQRNIRWGEIAAGLLIVFCSIGLVGSLWTTLTATHRVIPSLIFVTANAAIFAAGFYTLSRWRVRATSRAVLIIATLLVPLSVLAGLAAAGNGGAGASIADPVLLIAMLVGGCVYGWLLKRSGVSLVGRPLSWSSLAATLGPVLMLPVMPTLVRGFGDGAGWFVLIGSIIAAGSWLVEPVLRKASIDPLADKSLSRRGASIRSILLVTGSFAMVCLVAYTAFLIFQSHSESLNYRTFIPLALATLPAAITFTATARRYANQAADSIWRLAGNSAALFGVLGIGSMLAAVIGDANWLWAWGGLTTLAALSVAMAMRRFTWIAAACLPIGMSAVMTSTQWLGTRSFESLAVWQRLINGPSLVTVTVICLILATSMRLIQRKETGRFHPGTLSLIGCSSLSVMLASALLLGPETWLCGVPAWIIACGLLIAAAAIMICRQPFAGAIAIGMVLFSVAHFARGVDSSLVVGIVPLVTTKLCFTWAAMLAAVSFLSLRIQTDDSRRVCKIMLTIAIGLVSCTSMFWFARMITGMNSHPNFGTSMMTYAIPATAWIVILLSAKLQLATEFTSDGKHGKLIALTCFGFALWIGTSAGWSSSSDSKTQLIIAVSTLIGTAIVGATILNRLIHFPRNVTAGLFAIVVAVASVRLVLLNWAEPLFNGTSIDTTATIALMTWWTVASVTAAWFSRRQHSGALLPFGSLLLIGVCALGMPWLGWTHPVTLLQGSAAVAFPVMLGIRRFSRITKFDSMDFQTTDFQRAADWTCEGLWSITRLVGLASCAATLVALVFQIQELQFVFGTASFLVSIAAVFWWISGTRTLPWPMSISLLSGQVGGLLLAMGWANAGSLPLVIGAIWLVAAIASITRLAALSWQSDAWHAWTMIFASFAVSAIYYPGLGDTGPLRLLLYLGVANLAAGGIWVMTAERSKCRNASVRTAQYVMGFFVTIGGAVFLSQTAASELSMHWILCIASGWIATWVIAWRLACPDTDEIRSSIPDVELLVAIAGIIAVLCLGVWDDPTRTEFAITWPADLLTATSVLLLIATATRRSSRPGSFGGLVGVTALASGLAGMKTGLLSGVSDHSLLACGLLGGSVSIAAASLFMSPIIRSLSRRTDDGQRGYRRLIRACWVAATFIWIGSIIAAVYLGLAGERLGAHLAIGTVAVVTFALSELSERAWKSWKSPESRLRLQTVATGLSMVILIAVVESLAEVHPVLTIVMRILIAMIVVAPTLMFVFPMLLGRTIADRWAVAFRQGAFIAGGIATGAAASMIAIEFFVRTAGVGIPDLPMPLVWMVGCVLAAFSVLAAFVAIATGPDTTGPVSTGPGWMLPLRLKLSDRGRLVALYAAQGFAGITWLHKYLCLDVLAFVGLRPYWPYVVMVLAFASVGMTQWAIRRKDTVLADGLRRTALFLPLIPLIGFWLSAWFNNTVDGNRGSDLTHWVFGGGSVPYEWLLMMTAIYYVGVSMLWKRTGPRVSGIVLGNAALWVWLVQVPGWGFLTHPQAWLIPPAVCVMVIAHFSRKQLGTTAATGIRTAATSVIYISSTADMLIADIGSTLAGPIILITLALAGMLAGAVLRVRSFLFLGLTFVVIGLLSMVWHAQQAIDAVWPWWVFGITTGILILVGLALLEKNKPKLQQHAARLSAWEV